MQKIPFSISILVLIQSFSAIFLLIHVIISIPFVIVAFFDSAELGFLATFDTIWDWIMISIHATIAAALFARKKWARNFILFISGIGLIFGLINLAVGNAFSILAIIFDIVTILNLRRKSVRDWFIDETI